jgi:phage gp29-like protein
MDLPLRRILRPDATLRWSGWGARDYTPERVESVLRGALMGDHVAQWELFHLMEDTWPRLAKALAELKREVIKMDWRVEPWAEEEAAPTPEATERARLLSRAIWSMRPRPEEAANGFEATLMDILDAWGKGVSVLEIEWQLMSMTAGGTRQSLVAPNATFWVHPRHYAWTESGQLGLRIAGDRATAGPQGWVPFPLNKFIIATCRARTGPIIGAALLRPLAWWWCAANFSAAWALNLAQIFGLPIRWATYSQGASDALIAQIADMLENMGSAAWGAFPEGTQIELKEPGKGGGDWPQDSLLDRADRQADLLILGQTLTTDVGESGSRALGTVHEEVRDGIISSAATWCAAVLNLQLVPAFARLNWGDEEALPEFCPKPAEQQDLKADAERITMLLGAGVEVSRDWLYRNQQIPIPQKGEETVGGAQTTPAAPAAPPPAPASEDEDDGDPEETKAKRARMDGPTRTAPEALDEIIPAAIARVTDARARWLEPLGETMDRLIAAARNGSMDNAALDSFIAEAAANMPDLFASLDRAALADALEDALGAAALKGVQAGA